MALRLDDKWIWDFWLTEVAGTFHIFYLQAPKSITDPDLRHWNASIGHAISSDLSNWDVQADALTPGPPGAWDDKSTWTGSILEHEGTWYLFYTGTSTVENGTVQRVGLATSSDLIRFERHGERPLIEADTRWYETFDAGVWHDQAWRDPWVFRGQDGRFHATITARVNSGPVYGRGVIAHAVSDDLLRWSVQPPITRPDGFGQTEVSQLVRHGDSWYLIFCSDLETQGEERKRQGPGTGTYYLRADHPLGPFDLSQASPLSVDRDGTTYAGRIVDCGDGRLVLLSWQWRAADGSFAGVIADPIPVEVCETGDLRLVSQV